ncbi:MAG: hemerythrin domain-containing protein [Propionibacteriaceae bacterium]
MPTADVVELVKSDHREVERLFDLLQKDPITRGLNFPVVCALLIAHSRAEEAEVYPVAKDEAGETEEVSHSQGEHAEAEHMLEEMTAMDFESAEFEKSLDELIKAVSHHVEEEESKVLPGMQQRLSAERPAELAKAFIEARTEHLGDRPGQASREELQQAASNAGLSGISSSSKNELKEGLLEHAQQSED